MQEKTASLPHKKSTFVSEPRAIVLPAFLDRKWVENCSIINEKVSVPLTLDFSHTKQIDSAGIAFVYYLNRSFETANQTIILKNIPEDILLSLNKWRPSSEKEADSPSGTDGFFARIGGKTLKGFDVLVHAMSMLTEILYWGSFGLFKKRDFKRGVLLEQMFFLGNQALGTVSLLSFLIGFVLSMQSAIQLNQYGGGIFLAPLICIIMIKELGPLITAVILSGRNGSATTAEIATMMVGEEVDALKTMGLNPIQFIVVPKLWAMTLTMPLLSLCASVVGIFGGYLVAVLYLGIAPSLFFGELLRYIAFRDVVTNIIKSAVFSWLIVWVGAFHGFKVKGGAEEVGRETTASVVSGIFIVIIMDALFSFIF
jgi:phospholipid/cholesterol/gamma-HCH transport system permease protein